MTPWDFKFLKMIELNKAKANKILSCYSNVDELTKGGKGSGRKIGGFSHGVSKHLMNEEQYSKGWLHHEARTPEADEEFENHLRENHGMNEKEIATFAISAGGRHSGDHYANKKSFTDLMEPSVAKKHKESVAAGDFDEDLM